MIRGLEIILIASDSYLKGFKQGDMSKNYSHLSHSGRLNHGGTSGPSYLGGCDEWERKGAEILSMIRFLIC